MTCLICDRPRRTPGQSWCDQCCRAWDRASKADDGSICSAMEWAAKRARHFARRTQRPREAP